MATPKQLRYWERPPQPSDFTLHVSTLLMFVAILTHEKVGKDILVNLLESFGSYKLAEGVRAFSHMTDRLLFIALLIALGSGIFAFTRKRPARQYWWEAGLCLALVLWLDPK